MTDTTKTEALPYNPWRESLENCITGDNYLRSAEYDDLIQELDRLYSIVAERDRLAAECEALRAALSAILKSPTGCQFCDYGKPRLSIRTGSPCEHDEGCGFVLAHAAMGGKE